jgi:NAD(P)-dependent dehydrogenase (short-subunit alcohol dehydrogenase family)
VALIAGGGAAYAYPLFAAYAASKAATVRIAENLAEEGRIHPNFATVALAPGAMETAMLAKVRAAGAEVRTTVPMEEPVRFLEAFLLSDRCGFSGRFVHVRDPWREWLNGDSEVPAQQWRLRRVE